MPLPLLSGVHPQGTNIRGSLLLSRHENDTPCRIKMPVHGHLLSVPDNYVSSAEYILLLFVAGNRADNDGSAHSTLHHPPYSPGFYLIKTGRMCHSAGRLF